MGAHRSPPDPVPRGRLRVGSTPSSTSGRVLAVCRTRLHAAVTILVEASVVLHETVKARDRALHERRAVERAQDAFVVTAVHELKTPLTAIKGQAQLLHRHVGRNAGMDHDRLLDGLAQIEAAANKLATELDALIVEVERPLPEGDGTAEC